MIVGTAGHIDHGKTTLVRALTGVDTDRLPEEKKRGISIELGYAFLDGPPGGDRIGIVDVPGHERLVHTMLAGATGIDYALLLVAADDGVMPQTREHLAVLSLLGIERGAVVVTKSDRVAPERVEAVCAEAAQLVAPTTLAGCPVLAVSAHRGDGLGALTALLRQAAAETAAARDDAAAFRLAVDRVFTLDGVGTVVTGTVHRGRVRVGEELCLVPGGERARVRSLHAQNASVVEAGAGQRCAVALVGVAKDQVSRGQWLVAPAAELATARFDATITLWPGEANPLRSGTKVHVHLGAFSAVGSVALLDDALLRPGATGCVQLVLGQATGAWHGDRVVLRDASATRTLAGGTVLDPYAPARYRRTPARHAELDALAAPTAATRAAALVAVSPQGLDLARFAAAQGCPVDPPAGTLDGGLRAGAWVLGPAASDAARTTLLQALAGFHARQPDEPGPDAARLRRMALPRLPEPLFRALLADLVGHGRVGVQGSCVHLPEHGARLSATEERIAQKVAPTLSEAGFEGAWARDLARQAGEPEPIVRLTLSRLAQRGELHQVVRDLYYPAATMARLAALAREGAAAEGGHVTAARFRDATGLGRKRAIQILEHFDRIGLLRRVGDLHRLRADCTLFLEASSTEAAAA